MTSSQSKTSLKRVLLTPSKFLATDYKNKACFSYGYTQYGCFEDWDIALKVLENLPKNEKICNELLINNCVVKPYFDIEWLKADFPDYDNDRVKFHIKDILVEIFSRDYHFELKENDIKFAKCHRETKGTTKFSFHVVVSTHPTVVFENSNKAMSLAKKVIKEFKFDPSLIDTAVYSKTQNFRMVGHCKIGEFEPFVKEDGTDLKDYLITNIDRTKIILPADEQPDKKFTDIKIRDTESLDDDITDEMMAKIKLLHPTVEYNNRDAYGFYQFNYTNREEPCFFSEGPIKVYHDNIGFFGYKYEGEIYLGCHSGNCTDSSNSKKKYKLGKSSTITRNLTFEKVDCDNSFEIDRTFVNKCIDDGAMGISNLFCEMYLKPKRIKWINDVKNGISFFWDGKLWQEDDFAFIERLIVVTVVKVLRDFEKKELIENKEIRDENTEEKLKITNKIISKLNDGVNLQNILKFIKPLIRDTFFSKIKDIHPHFLSCKNGMVDLYSGEIRPAVPEDNITRSLELEYDENADCSDFDNFVRQITSNEMGENNDMYEYLKWVLGYAMQGNPKKKMFIILYGPHGFNGKSLLMNTISDILEYYAVSMDKSVVLESPKKTAGSHSTEICQLENCRFGILSDTKEDASIDDGQMKMLTGITDKLSVREIFGKQKEFTPTFVPFISTNHAIQVNLSDQAMYERLILIPFTLSFIDDPKLSYQRRSDNGLFDKFKKNKKGILKWLIHASIYYNKSQDRQVPQCIKDAKDLYNKNVNPYLDFLGNNFTKDGISTIKHTELLSLYKEYLKENGIKYVAKTAEKEFDSLLDINIEKKRKMYCGIRYKNDETEFDELDC